MATVKLSALEAYVRQTMLACGLNQADADTVADIVLRATVRGVGHHDIYDFPGRITGLLEKKLNPTPTLSKLAAFGGMESWDTDNALGEVGCAFAMDRAMELADAHGIGYCAIRNSNHNMASSPYVERASERGYIGLMLSKGPPTMGAPGRTDKPIGTLPMGYAFPTDHGYPVMMDACLAYASYGVLKERMDRGEPVPPYWGYDEDGAPTTDPARLAKGTRQPIGGHKGFGLIILGEVLTGLLSHGCIIDEAPGEGQATATAHAAFAFKADALLPMDQFEARTGEMIDRMEARAPGLHVPGQGSQKKREAAQAAGSIELTDALVETLNGLAEKAGAAGLA
ncbi:Ldh family oxidoreductase [Eubacteriales bacterium OttesenSCG-928-A19]|nr:Ldh family oxidoreductase [Eubacteriales bacterium OttesenSCG-928-A19]